MTATKPRGRELGLPFQGTPGPENAITDIPGLTVGFSTVLRDGPPRVATGVTAIIPRGADDDMMPVWAGFHALNGNGEMTGTHWIEDAGMFCGPLLITNTHSVGIVHHAAVRWMIKRYAKHFDRGFSWAMPVVAETYDGCLNDVNGLHVTEADALLALDSATRGPVAEGNAGGGTGMISYEFKGGTGTSSRLIEVAGQRGTVGVLVQANHGRRDWLQVLGVPIGKHLTQNLVRDKDAGSIIVYLGTDLPLLPHQLRRLAKRASIGIGRGGTVGGNSSGDIFLAFSTGNPMPCPQLAPPVWKLEAINDEHFDPIYQAAVEAIEEAVINAMLAARTLPMARETGRSVYAIDHEELLAVMRCYNRLG